MLQELMDSHGLSFRELPTRTGRTLSWVSRRLALVKVLPESVQASLRQGELCAHAAQKVLVPLARANRAHCERLVAAISPLHLSSRQIAQWWRAWRAADATVRERLVSEPLLYLRSVAALGQGAAMPVETPEGHATSSLVAVAGACLKARGQLTRLLTEHPELSAHDAVHSGLRQARNAWSSLEKTLEVLDAGR